MVNRGTANCDAASKNQDPAPPLTENTVGTTCASEASSLKDADSFVLGGQLNLEVLVPPGLTHLLCRSLALRTVRESVHSVLIFELVQGQISCMPQRTFEEPVTGSSQHAVILEAFGDMNFVVPLVVFLIDFGPAIHHHHVHHSSQIDTLRSFVGWFDLVL